MSRTPNDDRSDSMNPNNDAYWDSLDNHANQLNPNNDEYRGSEEDDDQSVKLISATFLQKVALITLRLCCHQSQIFQIYYALG